MLAESRDPARRYKRSASRPTVFRQSRLRVRRQYCVSLRRPVLSHLGIGANGAAGEFRCCMSLSAGAPRSSRLRRLAPRFNSKADESRDFGRLVPCSRSSHSCQGVVFHAVAGNGEPVDRWRWLCCSAPAGDVRFTRASGVLGDRVFAGRRRSKTPFRAVHVSERAKLCRHGTCGAGSAQEKPQFIPPGI